MATKFNMISDVKGFNGFGLPFSDTKYSGKLTATVEQTLTVPNNPNINNGTAPFQWLVIFSIEPGDSVWIALNNTAIAPAGTFSATDSELNPVARAVKDGDILHFISNNDNVEVGVAFYAL